MYGEFAVRGGEPRTDRVAASRPLSIADLLLEVEAYRRYLLAAGLSSGGVPTYRRWAAKFVDWLETHC